MDKHPRQETESAFAGTIVMCLLCGLFSGTLLDGGFFSEPAMCFYFPMSGYLLARLVVWKIRNTTPELTQVQRYGLILMPAYGFVQAFLISTAIRMMRVG